MIVIAIVYVISAITRLFIVDHSASTALPQLPSSSPLSRQDVSPALMLDAFTTHSLPPLSASDAVGGLSLGGVILSSSQPLSPPLSLSQLSPLSSSIHATGISPNPSLMPVSPASFLAISHLVVGDGSWWWSSISLPHPLRQVPVLSFWIQASDFGWPHHSPILLLPASLHSASGLSLAELKEKSIMMMGSKSLSLYGPSYSLKALFLLAFALLPMDVITRIRSTSNYLHDDDIADETSLPNVDDIDNSLLPQCVEFLTAILALAMRQEAKSTSLISAQIPYDGNSTWRSALQAKVHGGKQYFPLYSR